MAKTILPDVSNIPTHDEIAAQAYQIYLREGCVPGRDLDHWLQAENELRARANGNGNGSVSGRDSAQSEPRLVTRETSPAVAAQNSRSNSTRRVVAKR